MNEELQRAITAGVVVKTQGGHRCRLCDRDVPEILPHLRGKDHQNNLVWEALSNRDPHPFLLEALPSVVREAKQTGQLEVVDRTVFSYRCRVCARRPVVNGITPLKTHLDGNDHKKAARMLAAPSVSPPDPRIHPSPFEPSQVPPSTQPSITQNPYPASASSNPDFQPYQPPSIQQPQYRPTYNQQLQHPSFDHPHKTPSPLHSTQSPAYYPTTLQPRLPPPHISNSQPVVSSVPHISAVGLIQPPATSMTYSPIAGAPYPNAPLQPPAVPQPSGDLPGVGGNDPELQRALTAEVVAEIPREGGPTSFKCRACDKDFTGPAPCLEHLRSDRHKKKEQAWTQQRRHDIERQPFQDGWTRSLFDALPIVGRRNDQVDGSFRWTVVTGTDPFQPYDLVYKNLSVPRGLVLIFNYCFTGQEHERLGARWDSFNLKTLFHRMGYHVYLYEDYSKSRTEEALISTRNNPFLKDYDSFIVFILSHGKDGQIFFTTSFNEEDSMKLDDVRYKFTDPACPPLSGKPKLFFVNFCRARAEEPRPAYDGMAPHNPGPKNILTLYSCIDTFRAPRDPQNGTYFVQAWCEVLAAHAYNEELRDLHHRACRRLEDMNGSVPELQEYYFKKFYFNPVNTHQ